MKRIKKKWTSAIFWSLFLGFAIPFFALKIGIYIPSLSLPYALERFIEEIWCWPMIGCFFGFIAMITSPHPFSSRDC